MHSAPVLTPLVIALQDLDLDGDWDPEAHDRQMAGLYVQDCDDEDVYDEEKPTWDDDINIDDIVLPVALCSKEEKTKSKKDKKKRKKTGDEGEDYGLGQGDEPYREGGQWDEEWDGTEEMRKKKLQEYMDSLLELEFNDMASTTRVQRNNCVSQHPHV